MHLEIIIGSFTLYSFYLEIMAFLFNLRYIDFLRKVDQTNDVKFIAFIDSIKITRKLRIIILE
jgi:hypothetical protein